ncbi:MAG: ABC transporter permease [Phycisphaerales bacterium]|nr:ABC transporter permease [Phycisphaerales bacterium]
MNPFNLETLILGINNLRLHKLRALLTALGIIFGVAAVICMLSVSEGVTADELRMIQLLGTHNIILSSVKPPETSQVSQSNSALLEYGITYADRQLIEKTIPHIKTVVPLKGVAQKVQRHDRQMNAVVVGTTPAFFECVNVSAARGRLLSAQDAADAKNVCVIGKQVQDELFAYADPIGESIFVERQEGVVPYTVIGVMTAVETAGTPARGVQERNLNAEVYIPYSTAITRYGDTQVKRTSGSREFVKIELDGLYIPVDELENVLPVSQMVGRCFEHNHAKVDYDMRVPLQTLQLAERKKRNSQYLLGFIAGISLLVGGIGIMNIMLATVTERTREIGIRRALGARRIHITVQFLVETVLLSTAGGLIGVLLGYSGSTVISRIANWGDAIVQPWSVIISFGLSMLVGVFFGLWPAVQAARLDPIEALRYE